MSSKLEQQREHFDAIADSYFKNRQSPNHLHFKSKLWSYFFRNKEFLKAEVRSVLEPMCGYGEGRQIVQEYVVNEFDYMGFDYSEEILRFAREQNPGLKLEHQDITAYRAEREFDLVILLGGLHHVYSQVSRSLDNVVRALKPGGYFINYEPTHDNFIFRKVRERIYSRNEFFDDETERAFELREINSLYADAGLEVVDQVYPGLSAYVLYGNPDAFPFLNKAGRRMVDFFFAVDRPFFRRYPGRKFSFATLSLLRKK